MESETFKRTVAILPDNVRTGLQDAYAEHSRDSITRES